MPDASTETEDSTTANQEAPQCRKTVISEVTVIDYDLLGAVIFKVLKTFFPTLTAGTVEPNFWAVYQKEAEVYDREFVKKHDEDLNTTLIFAGLFSAVTSAFIVYIQADLRPDYAETTTALILVLIQEVKNLQYPGSTNHLPTIPDWAPNSACVTVQAILYSSLASSLFAAFLAVLGKQWLNRYLQRKGGSQIERNIDRQIKLEGMKQWFFSVAMEILPLMLQLALLLFGCALSRYLWTLDSTIAIVALVFTAVGALLYFLIGIAATISYACPYQTPLSIFIRSALIFDANHTKYIARCSLLLQSARKSFIFGANKIYLPIFSSARRWNRKDEVLPMQYRDACLPSSPKMSSLPTVIEPLSPLSDREAEFRTHAQNAACISWVLEHSTDRDVIHSAIQWIPDIEWHPHANMVDIPTLHARYAVENYFDRDGRIIPGLRDKAIASIKAYSHCIIHENLRSVAITGKSYLPDQAPRLHYDQLDVELQCLLDVTHAVICPGDGDDAYIMAAMLYRADDEPPHLTWIAQVIVQCTWCWCNAHAEKTTIIDDRESALEFLLDLCHLTRKYISPALDPPELETVISNLVTAIGLMVGMALHVDDLSVRDKSTRMDIYIARICDRLDLMTRSPIDLSQQIDSLFPVLRVLTVNPNHPAKSPHWRAATQSLRNLLSTVINSNVEENEKRELAYLILKLESRMEAEPYRELHVDEHHLDSVLRFLGGQLRLAPDQQPDWHEESLVHTLRALRNSVHANRPSFWNRDVGDNMRLALDAQHTKEVRLGALDVIKDFPRQKSLEGTVELPSEVCDEISSALRDFWDSLPEDSRVEYALGYIDVLCSLLKAPEYHPFLNRDLGPSLKDTFALKEENWPIRSNSASGSLDDMMTESAQIVMTKYSFESLLRDLCSIFSKSESSTENRVQIEL